MFLSWNFFLPYFPPFLIRTLWTETLDTLYLWEIECQGAFIKNNHLKRNKLGKKTRYGEPYNVYLWFVRLTRSCCQALQDADERLCNYMAINMVLNTRKGITIEMDCGCVNEMNYTLSCLPCLKHKEGATLAMNKKNVKDTEIKLCTIVLNSATFTRQRRSTPPYKLSFLRIS